MCRVAYTPGTKVPNWTLRDSAAAPPAEPTESTPNQPVATAPAAEELRVTAMGSSRRASDPHALADLGVPQALIRLACDEAQRVAVRVYLLDNSGSTAAHDGLGGAEATELMAEGGAASAAAAVVAVAAAVAVKYFN